MPNHLFPNGPTAKELFALKEGLKFRNEYGIFISATEFQTFSELFNTDRHEEREAIADLPIDASHITWIFTANDIAKVPAPIFNRLVVFHVPKPTLLQGRGIINTLFDETIVKLNRTGFCGGTNI